MDPEILKAALAPGPDCLPLEELGRYADGALDPQKRAAAAAHIRICVNCEAELALLEAMTSSPVRPLEHSPRRGWLPLAPASLMGIAALVLLTAVAGSLYFRGPKAPALPTSVSTGDEVLRSQTIAVRGPVGDLLEPPRRFEWVAIDRAGRYRARLMEVDRRELWSVSTSATGVDLPPEVRALSVPSKMLVWDVTAYDASGVALASSGVQSFRLVPQ